MRALWLIFRKTFKNFSDSFLENKIRVEYIYKFSPKLSLVAITWSPMTLGLIVKAIYRLRADSSGKQAI